MSNKPEIKKWVSLLAVLGFVIFIVYFLFFTDLEEVTVVIGGINVPIYLLSFVCVIGSVVFNALTWKATLESVSVKTTFRRVFNLGWVGTFMDSLIVGGWAGDVFITYLISKDKGVDGTKALASIIIKNVLELGVVLGSLIAGMILLFLNYSVSGFLMITIGITMLFLALPLFLIIYLSTNVSVTKRLIQLLARTIARFRSKSFNSSDLEKKISDFHDGIMSMKNNPRAMAKPIVFQTITWIFEILALFFVFVALGSLIDMDKIVITNTVVSSIRGQGVALAGFSQIVSSRLYEILGINLSLAQASSLLAGLANFWFKLIVSFIFFQMYGLETIAEKLLNKKFKEKTKKDKKDFKEQRDTNRRDFKKKTDKDKKDFEKLRDSNKSTYEERRDTNRRDFKKKTDKDKIYYEEQKDIHKKHFRARMNKDKKDFKDKKDSEK